MYEIAEFIEPYGMWIIKTVKTEEEAKRYCDERNNIADAMAEQWGNL